MYDFIIIGAGSAGCLLANRLSANPNHKVCLIEAGGSDRSYLVRRTNPLNMLMLMKSKRFNWGYHCEPEARTGNRKFFWPCGKGLGGYSSVNAMIYARGHQWDFDHRASLGNDELAVVDADLKVYDLNNLRIIDASIMPTITGSNIHAPTVLIAEKGAEKILADWK